MDKSITGSYTWSLPEMQLAQRLHMRSSKSGRKIRRRSLLLGLVCLIGGLAAWWQNQNPALGITFLLISALNFAMPLFIRHSVRKIYARKPDKDMVAHFEITDDRIANWSELITANFAWRTIIEARRSPEGFLLYPHERAFLWFPSSAFDDPADLDRLEELIKVHLPEFQQKK